MQNFNTAVAAIPLDDVLSILDALVHGLRPTTLNRLVNFLRVFLSVVVRTMGSSKDGEKNNEDNKQIGSH